MGFKRTHGIKFEIILWDDLPVTSSFIRNTCTTNPLSGIKESEPEEPVMRWICWSYWYENIIIINNM